MLSRVSCWRLCSIKNMFYTLFLISLCVVLLVWMLDEILDFTEKTRSLFLIKFSTHKLIPDTKYILSWDHKYLTSNVTDSFQKFNCPVNNCVFTTNKDLLNLSAFDAIVFGENILTSVNRPRERSPHQIFVFMSNESSYKYPACELYNDDYFNWTFTYRFDSDVLWRPFVVRDLAGDTVAPSAEVVWTILRNFVPLRSNIKSTLRSKMRAIVWIVDDCSFAGYDYLLRLEKHLYHFGLKLYKHRHFKKSSLYYSDILPQNYQFVLGFENSIVKDYVSQKVMEGYRNYAVPVVYGGANYSRFLPPGSYINARETHPYNLAQAIYEATRSQEAYKSYFKWRNYYSIEEDHSSLCDLCAALNGDKSKYAPAKKTFRVWWNSPHNMHRCLPTDYSDVEKLDNLTIQHL
ncbi:alpha-(1,3)-fucosyltransferase C-like [Cydia pomonella]|uniref:alpha-(1,3)-fucosyltransferase C-like n=1 Tax=Cydia pomonella TaxID=82600 RepID=UPI002ADE0DFE|nr:alpha-(1,3)-fucosyltransferase C-like [Cydia pomonella]